jgi:hypothetical protein
MKHLSMMVLAALCAMSLLLTGCKTQKASTPTNIAIERVSPIKGEPKKLSQKLTVDLISGKALFTDTDGSSLEHYIETSQLAKIQDAVNSNTWRIRELDRGDYQAGRVLYTLEIFEGPKKVETSQWLLPSRITIPQSNIMLMDSMDQSMRRLRPISETIDLLE